MLGWSLQGQVAELYTLDEFGGIEPRFKQLTQLEMLASLVDSTGRTELARILRSETCGNRCWKYFKVLRGKGLGCGVKLGAWNQVIPASAAHGSGAWTFNRELLIRFKRWEMHFMRQAFPCTPQPTRAG